MDNKFGVFFVLVILLLVYSRASVLVPLLSLDPVPSLEQPQNGSIVVGIVPVAMQHIIGPFCFSAIPVPSCGDLCSRVPL